ncbi:MAG: hypothetical protein LBK28_02085 [Propionibacteriaceae bacterium]|jgi:hypothetical protein|nr:hypothetical protein [Propionibacteriaceae bacterium]
MQVSSHHRLHHLKLVIVALLAFVIGICLLVTERLIHNDASSPIWLTFWPLEELGQTMATAGLFALVWEYFDAKDKAAREDERIRRLLRESAPDFRDAVIQGFAVDNDDLKRVATPELLDNLATNALALRLGDRAFAREVYDGLLKQTMASPERWHDVKVSLRLSCIQERSTVGTPLPPFSDPVFEVVVTWEYTLIPHQRVRRFACTSDRDEFHELLSEAPGTSVWFLAARPGISAGDRNCFELVQYTVDGKERPIRRSGRKTGQTYSVDIGEDAVSEGKAITVRHVYRTVTAKDAHGLVIATTAPVRGLAAELDYTNTDIADLQIVALTPTGTDTRRIKTIQGLAPRSIGVEIAGWLLPQSHLSFVWALEGEATVSETPAVAARSVSRV